MTAAEFIEGMRERQGSAKRRGYCPEKEMWGTVDDGR